ncbi:hypothetical protein [Streptomyces sp. 8L]|uniref:hypothetical protein n=1 Tax=Streptomyces sp. 8L TaxID=2877242 RepID=UPI001CD3DE08|nr:hypothetical protein [Streptomyces sp. 8L]MCA1221842.1 hypothetical protein [Streptomyces sp. 8L]
MTTSRTTRKTTTTTTTRTSASTNTGAPATAATSTEAGGSGATASMPLLERRYRRVLRLLPSFYREAREEEMVETYLYGIDEARLDELRPAVGEVASVAALAVRTRLGAAGAPPGYAALGRAVRLFAVCGVLLLAAQALTERVLTLVWAQGSAEGRALFLSGFTDHGRVSGAREVALWVLPLLWTAAYGALARDSGRAARVLAALAAVPDTLALASGTRGGADMALLTVSGAVFAWLTVAGVYGGFHTDAPPARLPGVPSGLALMAVCVAMGAVTVAWPTGADPGWATGAVYVLGATAYLVATRRTRSDAAPPDAALLLALAALGGLVLALRVAMLSLLLRVDAPGPVTLGSAILGAAAPPTTGALTVLGVRGARAARSGGLAEPIGSGGTQGDVASGGPG